MSPCLLLAEGGAGGAPPNIGGSRLVVSQVLDRERVVVAEHLQARAALAGDDLRVLGTQAQGDATAAYVGVTSASYRRRVGVVPSSWGSGVVAGWGSLWREGVEVMGSGGGVQVAAVDEDRADVLADGERRGEVDRVHRP